MSHLGPIFEVANIAWKMPLDRAQYLGGLGSAWILGVAGKSDEREVRPTKEQLDLLMEFFQQRPDDAAPMQKIVPFAIASTRRQSEVVKLRWEDLDVEGKRILVRGMKH
jgi:integrase